MRKTIFRAYGFVSILFIFLFLYGLLNLRLAVQRKEKLTDCVEITDYSRTIVQDYEAPLGEKTILMFCLQDVHSDYDTLYFMTEHQNVRVYLDGKEIYRMERAPGLILPRSPGIVYNEVVFQDIDKGKNVRIDVEPIYKGVNPMPELMFGNGYEIVKKIMISNLPIMILCASVILIGVFQIIVAVAGKDQEERVTIAISHSVFTILIGLWKILDSNFMALFASDAPILNILPFIVLMFLPLMMKKLIYDILNTYDSTAWKVPDVVTLAGIIAIILLQFFGIADFRETIFISEGCLVITILCCFAGIGVYAREEGFDKDAKTALAVTFLGLIWMALDAYTYFGTTGVTNFPVSMLLFLIFLLILIYNRLRISKKNMEVGMQALQYKKLAYHDALTGFFNRAAYTEFLAGKEYDPKKCILVAFDLNNLKKCNDELGHDKGDIYIKESAKIIMDCFGDRGRCFRLGGDEFGAILMDDTMEGCAKRAKRMRARVDEFNRNSGDIHMGIACGYAIYDPVEDADVHGTIRRADKMMYEEKFRMKQQQANA